MKLKYLQLLEFEAILYFNKELKYLLHVKKKKREVFISLFTKAVTVFLQITI